jgi:hypothetical protein
MVPLSLRHLCALHEAGFGTKRTCPDCLPLVRFRGEADIPRPLAAYWPTANDAVDGACSAASKCHRLVASKPERFKEVRPGNDDGVPKFWRNWRGHDDVMQTRSIRGSGEPVWVIALLKCALTIGTRSAQSIMASGFTAAQTGRTHDRTRPMLHKRQKVLAKAAPSTHDPKRTERATFAVMHNAAFQRAQNATRAQNRQPWLTNESCVFTRLI